MIATAYPLPFPFDAVETAWDGRYPIKLLVQCASGIDASGMKALTGVLEPFWLLAGAGGLAGRTVET